MSKDSVNQLRLPNLAKPYHNQGLSADHFLADRDRLLRLPEWQIESDCTANHGEFDWEKLPEATQDEYDRLCLLLDELQETEKWMT